VGFATLYPPCEPEDQTAQQKSAGETGAFSVSRKNPDYWKLNIGLPPPCSAICEL
jgi:hypothetical protein